MTIQITTIDIVCRLVAGLCILGFVCLFFFFWTVGGGEE